MTALIATTARQDGVELFGSFHLGDTELVLPVTAVQEVVNYPAVVTPVPLAPDYLLGLFNLRGCLIPIVHLGQLLQLPDGGACESAKIAVVAFRQGRIGLLFDATGEILRVQAGQKVDFESVGHAMIAGALKLDGGSRILQILSVEALQQLHDMPIPSIDAMAAETARQRAAMGRRRQGVSFRVGHTRLALPMEAIHEIIRVPALLRSVLATELCLGMLNLRGQTVAVVDFAHFLGLPRTASALAASDDYEDARRIIVIRQCGMDLGLLVDEVQSIVGYRDDELLAMPAFQADRPPLFAGCIQRDATTDTILVDAAVLMSDSGLTELTEGHRALYTLDSAQAGGARRQGARETYVTFRLERLMGMRIDQLREVIEFPADIMQAPAAPAYVRGMFNLRHKLVTIVDLRAMYGMPSCSEAAGAKMLVVEHEQEKFGLIVDAVEDIVTIDAGSKIGVPSILRPQIEQPFRSDMREVAELPDQRTVLLLDAVPLKTRLSSQMVH